MTKVLIVEDDLDLNNNIRDALRDEQLIVDCAFDGKIASKFLKKESYDCVILDINLPGKNGYEVCSLFRQYNTSTPVLMLTAFHELDDKVQGFESGADDYLTKPFYMKELLLRIQSLIRRKLNVTNEVNQDINILGDIVINTSIQKVSRQGTEVMLTPREYQILLRLIKANGDLVPKKELIKEIWGTNIDANTNTIEVYINFLRKKIDKPFGKDSIKTKIGYGYYFEDK